MEPTNKVVVKGARSFLAHTPGLVRYGSKPVREIESDPKAGDVITAGLRSYEKASAYLPNVTYLGGIQPEQLATIPRPWHDRDGESVRRYPYGEVMPEEDFYGVMRAIDTFELLWLNKDTATKARESLGSHPYWSDDELTELDNNETDANIAERIETGNGSLPLTLRDGSPIGVFNRAHDLDHSLFADVLLENLACKAAAVMAAKTLLGDLNVDPLSIPYILNTGEEAVGDRYQRGGGNLAKAIGEDSGCDNASGADVKAFCCGPNHALAMGASMISAGIFERVLVVGGCSLAKLGMKYQGHLSKDMPIVEDVLAGAAILLERDDGVSPVLRLDSIGTHSVGAGGSQGKILEELVSKPLARLGIKFTEVDKYATEMHNPEVTEPAGSGNVPELNYKLIAALAIRSGQIERADMDGFVETHGMTGFSPTQGHIASAIPYMPHAVDAIRSGKIKRAMFLAKGSLFLGRMTQMSDGLSFLLEQNEQA